MTTSGPEGPMINRRNVVKDDHITVDVTHEEDEAERHPMASTPGRAERLAASADGDRWVTAPLPEDWPQADLNQPLADAQNAARRLAEPGGLLLADGTYATTDQLLIALGRSVRTDAERTASRAETYRAAGWQDRLREAASVNFPPVADTPAAETLNVAGYEPKTNLVDPAVVARQLATYAAENEFDQAKAVRLEVLDDVIMNMRSLSLNFDPEAEKMTKRQMADHIVQIAHDVQRVAEVVRGTL